MKRAALLCLTLVLLLGACGSPQPAPVPPPPPLPEPKAAPAPDPVATPAPDAPDAGVPEEIPTSAFTVSIVDLDGKPLAEIAAIVTEAANAFDQPLVRGSITGADGRSDVAVPRDRVTYVRGWDPKLSYFANSFLTIEAGDAPLPAELSVVMAPAAILTAQFYGADGAPLPPDTLIEVLFSHPQQGPWWPTRAMTNADGRAIFDKVPAGKFDLSVSTEAGGTAELPATLLLPRDALDLGIVQLQ